MIWLVIKALMTLLPLIVQAVRDGRLRVATEREVISVLSAEFSKRIEAAKAAKRVGHDTSRLDPNDRSTR